MQMPRVIVKSVNSEWFQGEFSRRGLTQRRVAQALRLEPSSLSRILAGQRKLKLEEAATLSQLLEHSLEDILMVAGVPQPETDEKLKAAKNTIVLSGWVDDGHRIHWETPKGGKTAPLPPLAKKDVKAIRYQTVSGALDGALAYFRDARDGAGSAQEAIGKLAVVRVRGSREAPSYLGVLKRSYEVGRFTVLSLAGATIEESVQVESAAPVVWMKL